MWELGVRGKMVALLIVVGLIVLTAWPIGSWIVRHRWRQHQLRHTDEHAAILAACREIMAHPAWYTGDAAAIGRLGAGAAGLAASPGNGGSLSALAYLEAGGSPAADPANYYPNFGVDIDVRDPRLPEVLRRWEPGSLCLRGHPSKRVWCLEMSWGSNDFMYRLRAYPADADPEDLLDGGLIPGLYLIDEP